jgi:SAM-dependent methyltransferase
MRLSEYDLMYQIEEHLWWYRGMQAITRAILDRHYPSPGGLRILDAGCGTGGALSYLSRYGQVTGVDLVPHALRLAARRAPARLACASVAALPLPPATFDLVTSLDVLVLLPPEAEAAALAEMARVLAPGGRAFVRVAANDWLRGAHDRAWHVVHRYAAGELRARLEQAGLCVEYLSYANMWLFPVAVVKRLAERVWPPFNQSDLAISYGRLDGLLGAVLSSEARWLGRRGLPFGLSLIALARKQAPN